eukprot:scaffold23151_cov38-Prasinocladus_malaysianus.AAC.1
MTLMRWPAILPNMCICGGDEWWSLSWAAEPKARTLLQLLRQQGATKRAARPQRNRRLLGQRLERKPPLWAKVLTEMECAAGVISI